MNRATHRRALTSDDGDIGVLARMPGAVIAEALNKLPPADAAKEKKGTVVVDVPELGRVVVTCVLKRDPRWRRMFWSAARADLEG